MFSITITGKLKKVITAGFSCFFLLVQCFGQAAPQAVGRTTDELMKSIVSSEEPPYPAIARQARAGGPVEVEILVDEQGKVISAHAVSGHPLLQAASVNAVRTWKFRPVVIQGHAVKVSGRVICAYPPPEAPPGEETLSELEKAVRATPLSAEAHYELGSAYFKAARNEEAKIQFSRAIEIKPDYARAYLKLGHTNAHLRSYEQARAAYIRATELDPDSAEAFHALGLAYMALDQTEEAIKALNRSLQVEGPITTSHFMLGKCYWILKRYDEAVASYKRGLATYSDSDMGHYGLGEVYLSQENFTGAITELRQAIKLSDGQGLAHSHYYLGLALLGSGDRRSALKEYEILKQTKSEFAALLWTELRK